MRRVVTGEELAQLQNPNPFAMPRWRAPVYRTPLGIILAVKFVKLLWRLGRMVVRHPLAASVLALAAVIWLDLGWVTLAALVGAVVVLLAAWRWFWPGSFSRRVGRPARGKWRTWCYRRRWAAVMTIAGAAPCYQDRTLLPVLGKVAATRYTDRVHVRLVSGQSVTDFAACAENLAHGFGAMLCRVRTARPGAVVLEFIRRDALAALVPAQVIPDYPDLKALPVGRREDGLPWLVKLHGTHVLIAGATGAGESLAAVGAGPGHVPAHAVRPGPGPGRGSEADGAGFRPGDLRVLRCLCRRSRVDRGAAGPGGG
jgi:S-DNA-T family DNA segregation ATPase FtsK/SpoIIIE